ncbi:MAG: amino acid adenylation domain-containing protein, partial [Oscillospiraceae bacterium]|nr:amino acid adenylation domain-containing protein [Oscillospiraceae bacterium]
EVVVSTPTSGRFSEGAERLVGHYAAILPVRVAAEGDLTFEEQLKKTSADVMEIFEYQNFSFPDLCEAVKKQWPELVGPNKFPMSPILFNYDNMGEAPSLSGATASYYISPVIHYVDSDIYFNFIDMQSRMLLDCHYSADLFSEQTAGRLLDSFVAFMERALGNLSKKIKDLDIVTAGEKKTLLEKFNQSILPYIESSGENVAQSSVVERFYSVAGRAPESAALISENARMTYRELNEKTSQTARMLLESGVKRGDAVGIVMERSFEMLIAILGILKAGGAYLPIDPNYPANRIAYMLKDCAVSVVVTQSKFEKAAGGDGAIKVVVWEDAKLEGYATDNLPATPEARDPAYIIYTSGSTGEPKGVMIEHRSLYNIINYTVERLGLTQNDTALIRGPYCFDGTVFECFTWFFSGSGIFVLPAEDEKNPLRILDIIERYKIRFCFFAPSMLNVLLSFMEEKGGNAMKSVKYLVTGGEALSAATINKFHSLTDKAALVDIYGPTEAAIYATTYTHNRKESPPRTVIGFPVANAGIYILDEALKLVPAGVTGEICISGAGLARGYINKPELTGEKFVDNPYLPGEKMYRTGDRGRWLPDGAIEYRGRNDGQVKVRGFRVELGEIEARILGYDRVRETAVKKLTDSNGMDYLCAYLSADGEITPEEMRAHLSRDLPEHMIPSRYVFIKKMPKNHNDKIDRASLPEPLEAESHDAPAQGARESSMSETEKKVMAIWQNLLKNRNIGVGDNFFNIGGDSLKAAMMMMHLQREFKSTIPLNEIFNNTSVRSLSSYIDSLG